MVKILKELFGSGARVKVLEQLVLNPQERYYQRQLAELLGLPVGSVQQEIPRLQRAGVIATDRAGNRLYIQANQKCPIFPELKTMFLKASGVGEVLRDFLKQHRDEIQSAFIYGSYAKGREEAWSDIDLMVIGKVSDLVLSNILYEAERRLGGRELNHLLYSPQEFRKKAREKNHFVTTVLRESKIFLVGDGDELAAIIKQ